MEDQLHNDHHHHHHDNYDNVDEEQFQQEEIDFRTLLSNSKYDQIERYLLKMFQDRKNSRTNNKKNKNSFYCSHHHDHSLERSLFDIEEDLHKILLILLKQLEIFSTNGGITTTSKQEDLDYFGNNRQVIIQKLSDVLERQKSDNFNNDEIEKDFQQKKTATLNIQPTTYKDVGTSFINLDTEKVSDDLNGNQETSHQYNHVESEYSQLCLESDENFRRKLQRIKSQSSRSNHHHNHHHHYHLNKPDIDFVLGSSPTDATKTYSKLAMKQMNLAQLKQHNPLCTKINELKRTSTSLVGDSGGSNSSKINTTKNVSQIIKQIQSLIDELHLEHDWISTKLQYYQQQNQILLNKNQNLSKLIDKVNLKNMYTLSEHLIHIMDHLYELHQLNKHHLKSIIG